MEWPNVRGLVRTLITQNNDVQKGCPMQLNGITLKGIGHIFKQIMPILSPAHVLTIPGELTFFNQMTNTPG